MLKRTLAALICAAAVVTLAAQAPTDPRKLDAEGEKWVAATLKKMTLDDKVGQLLVSSFGSEYLSTDSPEYDALVKSIHDYRIGGFHVHEATSKVFDRITGRTGGWEDLP